MTMINAGELFKYSSDINEFQEGGFSKENRWEWPETLGSGYMSVIALKPGVFLEIEDFRLKEDVGIRFEHPFQLIGFNFSVSGSIKYEIGCGKRPDIINSYQQGYSVVSYIPKYQPVVARLSAGRKHLVTIGIDPQLLYTFNDGQHNDMLDGLLDIVDGDREQWYRHKSIMTPAVHLAIRQIFDCPYQNSLKRLFLESKVLELICHCLAQIESLRISPEDTPVLRSSDMERILEVGNILISNLDNPPSLEELARQVGTNKTTLNKGFRQVFGTSAFDYLRICRLEQAREFLKCRKMNVSEAALNVGYSQQSSFTRAYKNHFGENPTDHFC